MSQDEMLIRLGFYCGVAVDLLGDRQYALRFLGHAELVTPETYQVTVNEISERLLAAGHMKADEDLFETWGSR